MDFRRNRTFMPTNQGFIKNMDRSSSPERLTQAALAAPHPHSLFGELHQSTCYDIQTRDLEIAAPPQITCLAVYGLGKL